MHACLSLSNSELTQILFSFDMLLFYRREFGIWDCIRDWAVAIHRVIMGMFHLLFVGCRKIGEDWRLLISCGDCLSCNVVQTLEFVSLHMALFALSECLLLDVEFGKVIALLARASTVLRFILLAIYLDIRIVWGVVWHSYFRLDSSTANEILCSLLLRIFTLPNKSLTRIALLLEHLFLSFIGLRVEVWGASDVILYRLHLILLKMRGAVRRSLLLCHFGSRIVTLILVQDSLLEIVMRDFDLILGINLPYRILWFVRLLGRNCPLTDNSCVRGLGIINNLVLLLCLHVACSYDARLCNSFLICLANSSHRCIRVNFSIYRNLILLQDNLLLLLK